jgi:hypothetical protein
MVASTGLTHVCTLLLLPVLYHMVGLPQQMTQGMYGSSGVTSSKTVGIFSARSIPLPLVIDTAGTRQVSSSNLLFLLIFAIQLNEGDVQEE